jgi:phosphoribosylformylglycinamidine cyclo-ligase
MNLSEYKRAGVDLDKLKEYHIKISSLISSTYKNVLLGAGHYAGVIEIQGLKLALHIDGIGTKTELALKTGILEPIGIDCIAMNVNDLACIGAKPIAIVDYLALEKPMDDIVEKVIEGMIKAAKEAEVTIIGGETAIMPDVIKGFDLACAALGIVIDKIKAGNDILPGDVVIGIESNGLHSNGYSLIRKLIKEGKLDLEKWKYELLKPTRIYSNTILNVIKYIKAAAHITGGAFTKLRRLTNYKIKIDAPEPPEIFKEIEKAGVPHEEMYKVFNMGIGMIVITSPEYSEDVKKIISKNFKVYELGRVIDGKGIEIKTYKGIILHL